MGKSSRADSDTKADRKFNKKLEFYTKVTQTVATLVAKKTIAKKTKPNKRQRKLKAYDLSTLSDFLPSVEAQKEKEKTPVVFKVNCKNRKNLVLKEGNHLKAVMNHPVFQADPLGSIFQHLQNTQPVIEEKPKKSNTKDGKKKQKRKKTLSGPQSMDI